MRVLGIDPAMRGPCGLAVVAGPAGAPRLVGVGTRQAPTKGTPAGRVLVLARQLDALVIKLLSDGAPLALAYEASWFGTNIQTTRLLALCGAATIGIAAAHALDVIEVQPVEGKLALAGERLATKEMQIAAARQQFGATLTEHQADALGIALHAHAILARMQRTP
jgi:Holliday junction resolvasome RuvABC endonuclease subunit